MNSPLRSTLLTQTWAAALLLLAATPALAHVEQDAGSGFSNGFLHPFVGLDHVAAMVAVGLWGAFLGRPAIWMLPIVFPMIMAVGTAMGALGVPLPGTETGIALSSLLLGLLIAAAARAPLWVAGIIVGLFGVFHGYGHGVALPQAADPLSFALGFVTATVLLHFAGIAFGFLTEIKGGRTAVRSVGGVIAVVGAYFTVTMF